MEIVSENVASRYSFLKRSASGPPAVASLRASHASREGSPRTPASPCLHSRALDQRVTDVDIELKRHRKLVVHQSRRDEHALRVAQVQVAVANRVVAEGHVITIGDDRLVALAHSKRDEVISLALERGRDLGRHRGDHTLQVKRVDRDLAGDGIADTVRRLRNRGDPNHFGGAARNCWGCLRHLPYSTHSDVALRSSGISARGVPQIGKVTIYPRAARWPKSISFAICRGTRFG